MNEKDIYELIGNSFDDKIKLNFDDVKKRIATLPQDNITPISFAAPSVGKKRKNIYAAIAAMAACFVCVAALSVVLSQSKNDSASMESEAYFEVMEDSMTYDSAVCYSPEADCEEAPEAPLDGSMLYDDYTFSEPSSKNECYSFGSVSSPSDCISETDISASDLD